MIGKNNTVIKFDYPIPTKSGEKVSVLWHELQEQRQEFMTSSLKGDEDKKVLSAIRINEIENDLGLTITPFAFLSEQDTFE